MTRLNFGPRLDIIGKDEAPDPDDSDYHDDICELFGQVYTEELDDMIPPEGLLDFEDKR